MTGYLTLTSVIRPRFGHEIAAGHSLLLEIQNEIFLVYFSFFFSFSDLQSVTSLTERSLVY